MDENNNSTIEQKTEVKEEYRPMCANHPYLKTIFISMLIFLGAFCAFYVVSDWHFKRMMVIRPFNHEMGMAQKMMKNEMKTMDKMFKSQQRDMQKRSANIIHMEQDDDEYKVVIDLRAFDNNENNLQVKTNGNILTIDGRTIKKSKNNEQISEFQQNYLFGDNVNLAELEKETNGNFYVITIPIKTANER